MPTVKIPSSAVTTERFATEDEALSSLRGLLSRNESLWGRIWFGGVSAIRADQEKPWVVQYVMADVAMRACAHVTEYGDHAWTKDVDYAMHCVECGLFVKDSRQYVGADA